MDLNLEAQWQKKGFLRSKRYLDAVANKVVSLFVGKIQNAKAPGWWKRMALSDGPGGGGGILKRKIPGGFEIYYANKGAYDYLNVIESGREPYSIKDALLRSPHVRMSKLTGERYIIVPMKEKTSAANPVAPRRIGTMKDSGGSSRIKYDSEWTGGGSSYRHEQGPVKGGGFQYSQNKFIIVSESSDGWQYPKIDPTQIQKPLQKIVNEKLEKDKTLKELMIQDIEDILKKQLER